LYSATTLADLSTIPNDITIHPNSIRHSIKARRALYYICVQTKMPPPLNAFLENLLAEMDCDYQTLVLDKAVTPDLVLLQRIQAERERNTQTEANGNDRYVRRHHSQPIIGSYPWSSTKEPSRGSSRWDSGASSSSQFDGNNSDSQLMFPIRTSDDGTNYNPNTRADRWSVSRYHSDSLVSPRRSKDKVSLGSPAQSKNDPMLERKVSIKRTTISHLQSFDIESPPEMEMTWRQSGPSIRRRSSFRSLHKNRPSTAVQEMEIIWERENPPFAKPRAKTSDGGLTPNLKNVDESCNNQSTTPTTIRQCSSWISRTGTSILELFEAGILLVCGSFPPKLGQPGADDVHNNFDSCIRKFTILDLCGGDIAPACRQLEYDLTTLSMANLGI
jgi:hypothetical protein